MVEQFKAEIRVDGDSSGALAAIARVEAALKRLEGSTGKSFDSAFRGDKWKGLRAAVSGVRDLRAEYDKLEKAASVARTKDDFDKLGRTTDALNRKITNLNGALNGALASGGATSRQASILRGLQDDVAKLGAAVRESGADMKRRAKDFVAVPESLAKSIQKATTAYEKFKREAQDTGKEIGRSFRSIERVNSEFRNAYKAASKASTAIERLGQVAPDDRDFDWARRTASAVERLDQHTERMKRAFDEEVAAVRAYNRDVEAAYAENARREQRLREQLHAEALKENARRDREAAAQERELERQRVNRIRQAAARDSLAARLRVASSELGYAETQALTPGPLGGQAAAQQRLADFTAERARALRELQEAQLDFDRTQSDAGMRRLVAAQTAALSTTQALTRAQHEYNREHALEGSSMRYAMYDAAQYQMMKGAAYMAPAALGAYAYGKYESMFSDFQRTAEIDNGGLLAGGIPALNLSDNIRTASDEAFRELMSMGTRIPVAVSDIFDTAAKAGSIGLSGGPASLAFVESVSKFNAISDVADASMSAEALGRIGNLLGTNEYDRLASSIVTVGKSAAATDDQILKTTQELSMAAAGANFTADQIIGLAGGFASLSIPPERARSVMTDFVTTMSQGMAKTTPEVKALGTILGKSVDQVRSLWKSNPAGLFQDLSKAVSGMDAESMTLALDSIGLDGQRALPTFQAIAKNIREMGYEASAFAVSMDAADQGFKNTSILDDAMSAKADDLAGKFRTLLTSVINFAVEFGAATSGIVGPFMDGLKHVLTGVTEFIKLPVVKWFAGFASSALAVAGAFKAIGAGITYLKAGRLALDMVMNTVGVQSASKVGSLGHLFGIGGRGVPVAATAGGLSGAVSRGATPLIYPAGGYTKPVGPAVAGAAQAAAQVDDFAGSVRSAGGAASGATTVFGRMKQGLSNFGGRFMDFIGGGPGLVGLGLMAGTAAMGAWIGAENEKSREHLAASVDTLNGAFVEGTNDLKMTGGELAKALIPSIRDGRDWLQTAYDYGDVAPWDRDEATNRTNNAFIAMADKGTIGSFLSAREDYYGGRPSGGNQYNGALSTYGAAGLKRSDINLQTGYLQEFGDALSQMPAEQAWRVFSDFTKKSGLAASEYGQLLDTMFSENKSGYQAFATGMNEVLGTTLSTEFEGRFRDALGAAIVTGMKNEEHTGDAATGSRTREYTFGDENYKMVMGEYATMASGLMDEWNARVAHQDALAAATEWVGEYEGALQGLTVDGLNPASESHREFMSLAAGVATSAISQASALREENRSFSEIADTLNGARDSFIEFATSAGLSAAEAGKLADQLGLIPDKIMMDLYTEGLNEGTLSLEEFTKFLGGIPEGQTVKVDAITDEAAQKARDLGYTIQEIDGVIHITAHDSELQARLDAYMSVDGSTITFNIDALSEGAQAELQRVEAHLDGLRPGETRLIPVAIGDEASAALSALGFKIEELPDGQVKITAPTGIAQSELDAFIALINASEGTVKIRTQVDGNGVLPTQTGNPGIDAFNNRMNNMFSGSPYGPGYGFSANPNKPPTYGGGTSPYNPGPAPQPQPLPAPTPPPDATPGWYTPTLTPNVDLSEADGTMLQWSDQVPALIRPTPFLGVNTDPATQGATGWGYAAESLRPTPIMGAQTGPAVSSSMGWNAFAMGLNPQAPMGANPASAMAGASGWNAFAMGLHPIPFMSSNPAQAFAQSMMWMSLTQGLYPVPMMGANPSQAFSAAYSWYAFASSMRPTATLYANTGAAEAAINFAARDRTAVIHVVTSGGGPRIGGGIGYAGGGYTGAGPKFEPAGIVHRGEYVIPKRDVNQSTGLPYADALGRLMRGVPGYSGGGYVNQSNNGSSNPSIIELGPASLHRIAQAVAPILKVDSTVLANATSNSYKTSTRRGAN